MFIIWLCWLFRFWKGDRGPYGYLRTWNWPITAREISQPYNKYILLDGWPANMAGYFTSRQYFGEPSGEPKYNSTSKNTQPYWLVNRLIRCLLYDCFLLTFIKSLLFFIHTKIARWCLICWNSLRCFHTARKLVCSFVTVIGCWARTSPHFPAFFGCARTYMQTLLRLSVYWWNEPFSWTAFGLLNVCSQFFGEINGSQFILEHLLFFVNQLKSFFPVDGCQRIHTLRSDFVFWFELLLFALLRREISNSFSSLKLLFTSSGWTLMLKQGSRSRVHTVMKSHEKLWNLKMHFPGLKKSWILGKMAEVMEKLWNFISLVQRFCAVWKLEKFS